MLSEDQRERLEAWVRSIAPRALAYARSITRDLTRAEDVVQECLYRLLRRAAEYDLERDGVRLLFTSISNLCINQATREKAILSLDTQGDGDDRPIPVLDRSTLTPEQILQHRELEETIRQALLQLNPLQRAAIELRALGMSKDEIAAALGVSASNAGVLIHRGRQALAVILGTHLGVETRETV
jgi:RNA polymerase sigma factor (sigma-70 family)